MNETSKLNSQRNKAMDEIIEIEEITHPKLYREMMKFKGRIQLATQRKNQLWKKIKEIHKEIKNE